MSCSMAPSGNLVASGGLDNMCTIANIKGASPKTLRELDAHEGGYRSTMYASSELSSTPIPTGFTVNSVTNWVMVNSVTNYERIH